jgi:hypothetical protein
LGERNGEKGNNQEIAVKKATAPKTARRVIKQSKGAFESPDSFREDLEGDETYSWCASTARRNTWYRVRCKSLSAVAVAAVKRSGRPQPF